MSPRARKNLARGAGILAALLVLLFVAAGISAYVCSRNIKVARYEVTLDGIAHPARLVVVADLHGKVFGEDNEPLYDLVRAQEPDAVVLLGDLFPSRFEEADRDYVIGLTERLLEIAPVYFAMGNHEASYTAEYGRAWVGEIEAAGAVVLDEAWLDCEIAGNTVRLGGTLGHGYLFGRKREELDASPEYAVLDALEHSPHPAILLAHMPDTVALSDGRENWHIGLVLSAHTHGGVIRLPGLGGLYAPMQGLFPRYDYGEFALNEQMRLIISSGLSDHNGLPRVFNLPEICVVELCAKK